MNALIDRNDLDLLILERITHHNAANTTWTNDRLSGDLFFQRIERIYWPKLIFGKKKVYLISDQLELSDLDSIPVNTDFDLGVDVVRSR